MRFNKLWIIGCIVSIYAGVLPGTAPFKYTQTEAYLHLPQLKNLVDTWFGNVPITEQQKTENPDLYKSYQGLHGSLFKYNKIVSAVLQKEQEFKDYYVFYHGTEPMWAVFNDFITQLYELETGKPAGKDFIFLRDFKSPRWQNLPQINSFLDSTVDVQKSIARTSGNPWVLSEYHPPLNAGFLLATNLSLFGSTTRPNSSTWKYFLKSLSANPGMMGKLIAGYLTPWIKNPQTLGHLAAIFVILAEYIETNEGLLYQIFVPRAIVDEIAYLSFPRANPWNIPVGADSWDDSRKRYTRIEPILSMYRNEPEHIKNFMDGMEARIIPYAQYFANPSSGIKIFMYSTLDDEKKQKYQTCIKNIAARIYKMYISGSKKNELNKK